MRCDLPATAAALLLTVLAAAVPASAQSVDKALLWDARLDAFVPSDADDADDAVDESTLQRRAFKALPDDVDRRFAWARWAATNGLRDVAIAELRVAQELAPGYTDVTVHLARVLSWEERWDEAAAVVDGVLEAQPAHGAALLVRGDVALWRGEPAEAIPYYQRAAGVRPDDPIVQQKLLQAHVALDDDPLLLAWLRTQPLREDTAERRAVRTRAERADAPARIDAGFTYTFTEQADWVEGRLALSTRLGERWTVGAGAWAQRRNYNPRQRDVSVTGLLALRATERLTLRVEPLVTPDADFAPQWWLDGGASYEVLPRLSLSVDARHAEYTNVVANTLYPSITVSPWRLSFQSTAFATWSRPGGTTFAGRLISSFRITETQRIEWWTQVGTEPIEPLLSRLFDEPLQLGLVLAAVADLRPLTSLRFTYSYVTPLGNAEETRFVPRRHALGIALTYRFRWGTPYRAPVVTPAPRDAGLRPAPRAHGGESMRAHAPSSHEATEIILSGAEG